jgi:L-iditol 2-dehydrogenase
MAMPADPGPGEVLVKIYAVGICGSDLHWYLEGGIGPTHAKYPQILGHEPAGEILSVGAGVTDRKAGDRVAIEPAINCGYCEFCRSGRHNICVRSRFMGDANTRGLFREYAVVPAANTVRIPDGMNYVKATVIEPLAVVLHVIAMARIPVGSTVVVIGAGPIGTLTAAAARVSGASRIIIADQVRHRVELALKMGADTGVYLPEESLVEKVQDLTGGRGADVVLDAAAKSETINDGLRITRIGGQFVLVGLPSERELKIDMHLAMGKELNVQTIKRSNHTAHPAIELLESGRVGDALVTHRLRLAETPRAFQMLTEYTDGVGKVVIEIPS